MFILWLFIMTIALFCHVGGEVFTSTSQLKNLIQLEANLLTILSEFMTNRQTESKFLQEQYVLRKRQHLQIISSHHKLHHPLNAYQIIKRFAIDWPNIENAMRKTATSIQMFDWAVIAEDPKFPTYEDFKGAVEGLTGLQDTYKLETSSLADGIINGVNYGSNLTASDCFELGRELYHMEYFNRSVSWLKVALMKYEREGLKSAQKVDIKEHLAYALYKSGNRSGALEVIDKVLQMRLPTTVKSNIVHWKSEVKLEDLEDFQEKEKEVTGNEFNFKAVCREGLTSRPDEVACLKCKWLFRNPNFLTPFKVEEVHVHPSFVAYMYHDALSEKEISIAIAEAENQMTRSISYENGEIIRKSKHRTAKTYFVPNGENKINAFVNRKIKDMTGLNFELLEVIQIVNYGIGGQYAPHSDYYGSNNESHKFPDTWGDRIATVVFYMSDVEQGGATVFPLLNVVAKPRKGSALVWYNLLPNGQPNNMTIHCSCPVIVGSKWILAKWIHEREQVFTRPCTIDNHFWKPWN